MAQEAGYRAFLGTIGVIRKGNYGMYWKRWLRWTVSCLLAICCCAVAAELLPARDGAGFARGQVPAEAPPDAGLNILNDSELPATSPLAYYEVRFTTSGGTLPLHWRVEKGALPPGIELEANGLLHGAARSGGEFRFTISVRDGSGQRAQKEFVLVVHSALEVRWKSVAHVNGNRIDGSVEVSNQTLDDMDLTFVVLAVAPNGRATAIGYQHFRLRRGTVGQELPFGDTLARGAYVVYVDVVGEVAPKNVIYREQLQTHSLQIAVGP